MPNHQESRSTKVASLNRFYDQTSRASISQALSSRRLKPERAFDLLVQGTAPSKLVAGKIALERAYAAPDSDHGQEKLDWFEKANGLFQQVEATELLEDHRLSPTAVDARLMRSQMGSFGHLILLGSLPPRAVAQQNYTALVQTASELNQARHRGYETADIKNREKASGLVGEMVSLALLQRFALQTDTTGESFAFPAFYGSGFTQNTHGSTVNRNWDISVFTKYDQAPPALTYRLEVKSLKDVHTSGNHPHDAAGIERVYVSPDLALTHQEKHANLKGLIAAALDYETLKTQAGHPEPGSRVSEELNERTALLLDILG